MSNQEIKKEQEVVYFVDGDRFAHQGAAALKHVTQQELARKVNISVTMLSNIETDRKFPTHSCCKI